MCVCAGTSATTAQLFLCTEDGVLLHNDLSVARDIIKMDGYVFVSVSVPDTTLLLRIAPLQDVADEAFMSSRLVGDKLLSGSPRDCLYRATTVGTDKGKGIVNLCEGMVS